MSTEKTIATTATFKPENLGEHLRDKIHVQVADLMPAEMWKQLVETEVNKFVNGHEEKDYRGNRVHHPSRLSKIIDEELNKLARERVVELLKSEEWSGSWVGGQHEVGEAIRDLIKNNAGQILANMLENTISQAMSQMVMQIQRRSY